MRKRGVAGRGGKAVSPVRQGLASSGAGKPEARPTVGLLGTEASCFIRTWGRKPGESFKMFPLSLGDPAQQGHWGSSVASHLPGQQLLKHQ